MFSFKGLTAVMDAAELLQLRFIHLEPCNKRREMTQVLCDMSEVLPVVCCSSRALCSVGSTASASTAASWSREVKPTCACGSAHIDGTVSAQPQKYITHSNRPTLETRACFSEFNSLFSFSSPRRRSCWLSPERRRQVFRWSCQLGGKSSAARE